MLFFEAKIEVDGKPEPNVWKTKEGESKKSYKLNISQNDGRDTATVGCSEDIYNKVKRHDTLKAVFTFSEGTNSTGKYASLKLDSVELYAPGKPGIAPGTK